MTYSCAIFASPAEPLADAQARKLARLCEKAGVRPGDRVLEIGFGWGSLTLMLVKHFGATVTGLTLSRQQLELAQRRVDEAGLADKVSFLLCDYRTHVPAGGARRAPPRRRGCNLLLFYSCYVI